MPNPKKHSFSRMNTFADICERRHAFDALIPGDWDTPAIKRGNHVHDSLEQMANLMVAGESARDAAEYLAENPPEGYLKQKVLAGYLERAVPVFELLDPIKGGVEAWFDDVEGLPIIGKIDLQSMTIPVFDDHGRPSHAISGHCVIDHKTTASPARIKTKWDAKKSLQLQIYCLATGARTAGFLWYLPTGEVRGTMVDFSEDELAKAKLWLHHTTNVIQSRWQEAKTLGASGGGPGPHLSGYDLSPFSLAAPGHGLCNEKFCDHWEQCLGKAQKDG